jgi:hypothetical protein
VRKRKVVEVKEPMWWGAVVSGHKAFGGRWMLLPQGAIGTGRFWFNAKTKSNTAKK